MGTKNTEIMMGLLVAVLVSVMITEVYAQGLPLTRPDINEQTRIVQNLVEFTYRSDRLVLAPEIRAFELLAITNEGGSTIQGWRLSFEDESALFPAVGYQLQYNKSMIHLRYWLYHHHKEGGREIEREKREEEDKMKNERYN